MVLLTGIESINCMICVENQFVIIRQSKNEKAYAYRCTDRENAHANQSQSGADPGNLKGGGGGGGGTNNEKLQLSEKWAGFTEGGGCGRGVCPLTREARTLLIAVRSKYYFLKTLYYATMNI